MIVESFLNSPCFVKKAKIMGFPNRETAKVPDSRQDPGSRKQNHRERQQF